MTATALAWPGRGQPVHPARATPGEEDPRAGPARPCRSDPKADSADHPGADQKAGLQPADFRRAAQRRGIDLAMLALGLLVLELVWRWLAPDQQEFDETTWCWVSLAWWPCR